MKQATAPATQTDAEDTPAPVKHALIAETVRAEIEAGRYGAEDRLPSEAQLARRFHVSRPTAARALRDLQSQGLLERRIGSGTYLKRTPASHSGLFGLLIPGLGNTEIFEPICTEIARRAQAAQFATLWGDPSHRDLEVRSRESEDLCRQFIERKVSGVFFAPLELTTAHEQVNQRIVSMLSGAGIPIVLLDRDLCEYPGRSPFDLVGIDNFNAGYRLAAHLIGQRYHHLRFVARSGSAHTVSLRISGAREAMILSGMMPDPDWIWHGDPASESFVRAVMSPRKAHPPDALICANDLTAATLLRTLDGLGYHVPEDIAVTGFDDVNYATLLTVPMTTIHQPCHELGTAAIETMLRRLEQRDRPPRTILFDAPLVVRRSSARKK